MNYTFYIMNKLIKNAAIKKKIKANIDIYYKNYNVILYFSLIITTYIIFPPRIYFPKIL
jgi:hypothetical protein